MKNFSVILSTAAIILAAVALIQVREVSSSSIDAAALANALKNNPQMVIDALQAHQEQQIAAQEKEAQEALSKYADEINNSENAPFIGPKDAKVVVVEFFDFSCGYCKRLAPAMEETMSAYNDVKFVFKPLSFVAPVSSYQAKAAMAANNQGKFVEFYKAVLNSTERMNEASVDAVAESLGLDMNKYKADLNSDETSNALNEFSTTAQNARVNGVPMVLVNGKHVQTMSATELKEAIDAVK